MDDYQQFCSGKPVELFFSLIWSNRSVLLPIKRRLPLPSRAVFFPQNGSVNPDPNPPTSGPRGDEMTWTHDLAVSLQLQYCMHNKFLSGGHARFSKSLLNRRLRRGTLSRTCTHTHCLNVRLTCCCYDLDCS